VATLRTTCHQYRSLPIRAGQIIRHNRCNLLTNASRPSVDRSLGMRRFRGTNSEGIQAAKKMLVAGTPPHRVTKCLL
jgi:hypothetical protein